MTDDYEVPPSRESGSSQSSTPYFFNKNIPATSAWLEGDPPGNRQFFRFGEGRRFVLESGDHVESPTLAYETWGSLNSDASNAVLICHALTGDSHLAGQQDDSHPTPGWWDDLVGPGKAIDTDSYFVVCSNVLGGCQGSTGPSSIDPVTQKRYGSRFPAVTIRDMVRAQERLTNHLGIQQWLSVIGGSMGGMQVLEWAVLFPDRLLSAVPIASSYAASPWQIAFSAIGRKVIALDPRWQGGDYYDAADDEGPHMGLAAARAVGMVSYRTDEVMEKRFARYLVDPHAIYGNWDRFRIESYLDYQGEKLARRFDANTYIVLNKAMDLHDLGRRPGGLEAAVERISVPVLCMSVTSDLLYPPRQQEEIRDVIVKLGGECDLVMIESPHGHDGFLLEPDQVGEAVAPFLAKVAEQG